VFLFEGDATVAGTAIPLHHLAVLGEGEGVAIDAGTQGARLLLVSGKPLGESIVQYGPFVMNTRAEIEQAMADYRDAGWCGARRTWSRSRIIRVRAHISLILGLNVL